MLPKEVMACLREWASAWKLMSGVSSGVRLRQDNLQGHKKQSERLVSAEPAALCGSGSAQSLLLHAGAQLVVQLLGAVGVLELMGNHVKLTPKLKHRLKPYFSS